MDYTKMTNKEVELYQRIRDEEVERSASVVMILVGALPLLFLLPLYPIVVGILLWDLLRAK